MADRLADGSSRTISSARERGLGRSRPAAARRAAAARRRTRLEVEARVRDQPVEPLAGDPRSMNPACLAPRRGTRSPRRSACGTRATSWATSAIPRTSAARGTERDRRPVQHQVALVLREHAGDDLAQLDLPAPFSPTKAWTVPGRTATETLEGPGRPEGLPEPPHLEVDGLVVRTWWRVSDPVASARPLRERQEGLDVGLGHHAASGSVASGSTPGTGVPDRMASIRFLCRARPRWPASA